MRLEEFPAIHPICKRGLLPAGAALKEGTQSCLPEERTVDRQLCSARLARGARFIQAASPFERSSDHIMSRFRDRCASARLSLLPCGMVVRRRPCGPRTGLPWPFGFRYPPFHTVCNGRLLDRGARQLRRLAIHILRRCETVLPANERVLGHGYGVNQFVCHWLLNFPFRLSLDSRVEVKVLGPLVSHDNRASPLCRAIPSHDGKTHLGE